jgi:quercetin dioxygenase-like cupin family protein
LKIIHYEEAATKKYSGSEFQGVAGRVVIGKADGAKNFCMRVFELAPGGYSSEDSHDWEHEVFVYSGQGVVYNNGEWVPVQSGSVIFIPPNEKHQLKNTGHAPFVFVCLIPSGHPEI